MIFGTHDDKTLEQLSDVEQHAVNVALMADAHAGYYMPVGGVAAYDNKVSVTGVGVDIGCGNCSVKLDLRASDFSGAQLREIGYEIQDSIAIGVGRANRHADAPTDHPLFSSGVWDIVPAEHRNQLREKAREQLGSVGSGNHYIDLFEDEGGALWVGVHFGSRAFGYKVSTAFSAIAQNKSWGEKFKVDQPDLLGLYSEAGTDYWSLMSLAGEYAYAGRDWVCDTVAEMIGATSSTAFTTTTTSLGRRRIGAKR